MRRLPALVLAIGLTVGALGPLPHAQGAPPRKKVLFLTHAGLYKHPSLALAEEAVTELLRGGKR